MSFKLPFLTHTNNVGKVLYANQLSPIKQVQSRYGGFVYSLIKPRIYDCIDHRSSMCRNISYLDNITDLNVLCESNTSLAVQSEHCASGDLEVKPAAKGVGDWKQT